MRSLQMIITLLPFISIGQDTLPPPPKYDVEAPEILPNVICLCDQEAEFPGGMDAFNDFLQQKLYLGNLKSLDSRSTHTIYVDFLVGKTGEVSNVEVHKLDDPEVVNRIKNTLLGMPRWSPYLYGMEEPMPTRVRVPIKLVVGDPRYNL